MTSHRLTLKLGLLGASIVSACSLTVPSEDDVFGTPGGSSGSPSAGSGNAASGGEPPDNGGTGGTPTAGGGNASSGTAGAGADAGGSDAGAGASQGGAGGEPPMEPEPTGEIVNPSFEGSLLGWTVAPKTSALFIQYSGAAVTAVDGTSVLSGWDKRWDDPKITTKEPYAARVFPVVKGLEDGTYRLSAQMASMSLMPKAELYAANCGGADPEPASSSAAAWHEVAIEAVEVVGGECEIGFDIDARVGDWINIDLVALTKVDPK